ncbi:MAG TPA: ChbG/HpnK family deacetylase [Armatimonadota bacterium]|jgi:hypothetical protein
MPARAVLMNADDLGLWPSIDTGIFSAWAQQAIGGSSVFANAPELPAVLAGARAVGLPVGVHLNLTFGNPLSPPEEIPALLGSDGRFMKRALWTLPLPVEQVRAELTRQVQRVVAVGCPPSHLDSHHHVHRYPEVLGVVIELACMLQLPVRAVDADMRETLRGAGIATPDHFSMQFYGERASVETLIALVEASAGGVLEIMTHPGLVTPDLPSGYSAERAVELATLCDPRWQAYLLAHDIALIGYPALREHCQ